MAGQIGSLLDDLGMVLQAALEQGPLETGAVQAQPFNLAQGSVCDFLPICYSNVLTTGAVHTYRGL